MLYSYFGTSKDTFAPTKVDSPLPKDGFFLERNKMSKLLFQGYTIHQKTNMSASEVIVSRVDKVLTMHPTNYKRFLDEYEVNRGISVGDFKELMDTLIKIYE